VIWLTLAVDDISDGDIGGRISILVSWKHFRDIEDTSLTLATCLVRDGRIIRYSIPGDWLIMVAEIYGILYSRLNTLAQVIRFSMAPEDPSVPVSASDPSILVLPSLTPTITANSPGPGIYSSITLRDIVHDLIADTSNTSESLKLLKFIGQRTDSRIVEALYSVKMESNDVSEGLKGTNSLVPSKGRRRGNASMLSSAWATDDDFVVDDEEADDLPLRSSSKNHSIRKPPSHLSEQWTNIHVSICSAVVEALDSKGENVQSNASVDGVESLDTMFWSSLEEQPESSMARTMSVAQLFFTNSKSS
jgi:RNA polymerase I-specific transcription initiation factor RRN6